MPLIVLLVCTTWCSMPATILQEKGTCVMDALFGLMTLSFVFEPLLLVSEDMSRIVSASRFPLRPLAGQRPETNCWRLRNVSDNWFERK